MKTRSLNTAEDVQKASQDLLKIVDSLPVVLTITKGSRIRSIGQNSRYWASLNQYLDELNTQVAMVSEHTGFTPFEVRKLIAQELPIEYHGIIFARTDTAVHDILKTIYDIPTSTRLGTKEFSVFEERMEQTISEIGGEVRAIAGRMV